MFSDKQHTPLHPLVYWSTTPLVDTTMCSLQAGVSKHQSAQEQGRRWGPCSWGRWIHTVFYPCACCFMTFNTSLWLYLGSFICKSIMAKAFPKQDCCGERKWTKWCRKQRAGRASAMHSLRSIAVCNMHSFQLFFKNNLFSWQLRGSCGTKSYFP